MLVFAAACSSATPAVTPSPSPSLAASPAAPAALVVGTYAGAGSTVRIIDLQGNVVARASFAAPALPDVPYCPPFVQPPVRAAGGAAFYADSKGVIRRLGLDGAFRTVATLKLSGAQRFLSFAVSPDGNQLMATIISLPGKSTPWTEDIERATAGGSTTIVSHTNLGAAQPAPTMITGWDSSGPTATTNTLLCSRENVISQEYTGSALVHLGFDGSVLDTIGGPDCVPMDELPNGTVLCRLRLSDCGSLNVRTSSGTTIWSRVPGCNFFEPRLSPDGQAVAVNADRGIVFQRNRTQPASFARQEAPDYSIVGWAAPGTLLVIKQSGDLGLASTLDPLVFSALGVNIGGPCIGCVPSQLTLAGLISAS